MFFPGLKVKQAVQKRLPCIILAGLQGKKKWTDHGLSFYKR